MKHAKQNSTRLVKALDYRHMVDVTLKGRDAEMVRGYVLAMGGKWILMHATTAGGAPDETVAIRRRHISHVAKTKHFAARVLEAWKLPVPQSELGMQDLDTTRAVLKALGDGGALLCVMRDVAWPDGMLIGSLAEVEKKRVWLLEVTYRARWKRRLTGIKPRHISRIASGGDYLEQLALVAGPRPPRSATEGSTRADSPGSAGPGTTEPTPDDNDR